MLFPLICCPARGKVRIDMAIVSGDARESVDPEEVESKWLKGGSSARGYIIILKVKI